jgi:carboxypeptidase C (cathepsin A)
MKNFSGRGAPGGLTWGALELTMRPWIRTLLPCTALVLCAGNPGSASGYSTDPAASLPALLEDAAVTAHQITLAGPPIAYTATAGHLTAASPANQAPEAALFYVAYTVAGADPATRPLTFCYNGGPGSSSVWLHLGSFGPKRLVTGDPSTSGPVPFPLVDNPDSLLDSTDLVFVDAVGTGLSEAIAPNTNQTFWGVDQDAAVFRDFIQRYLTVNQRQASPLYLFGESYGTPRSAVLANLLGAAGIRPAGVILQSSILNYNTNGAAGPDISCAGFLPSYAALGAYFGLDAPAPGDFGGFIQQMRVFTAATYGPAVNAWLKDPAPPAPATVARLQATTGIGAALWNHEFNFLPRDFQKDLMRGTLIGRYDGRVAVPASSPLASAGDPSSSFIVPSFGTAIASYLTDFLGYGHGTEYALSGQAEDTWDFSHDGQALPDTIPDLMSALLRDPALKVLSLNGYHDLATPFYQTELDLARMGAQPTLQIKHYNGGHMVYLDDTSRPLEKADLAAFYQAAPGWAGSPDHAMIAGPTQRWLVTAAPGMGVGGPFTPAKALLDPYVPPAQRHPSLAPPASGAALKDQAARKLANQPG